MLKTKIPNNFDKGPDMVTPYVTVALEELNVAINAGKKLFLVLNMVILEPCLSRAERIVREVSLCM